jgi:isoamylase
MLRYTRELIALRRRHACLTTNRFFDGKPVEGRGLPDIAWHGINLGEAPWDARDARLLRYTLAGLSQDEEDLHVVLNMSERTANVELPMVSGRRWHLALDTALASPDDVVSRDAQTAYSGASYLSRARSVVVLEARTQ